MFVDGRDLLRLAAAACMALIGLHSLTGCVPVRSAEETDGELLAFASGSEIIIGLSVALSGSGIAPIGIDIQRGAELALEERPTIQVGDRTIAVRLLILDDLCSADGGQAAANRFVSDRRVAAVIGPMCSSGCRAAAPIFDAAAFTTISPSCTSANLTQSGFRSFNRVVVSDSVQGVVAAHFIYEQLGVTRVATLHDGSPYGEGLAQVVAERFRALGGRIVAEDAISVGDVDYRALIEDIGRESPELIYFAGFAAEGARLAEQRVDAGMDILFMGGDGLRTDEFTYLAGRESEGVYVSAFLPGGSPALTQFLDRYEERYGQQPSGPYHANAYDAVHLLLDAVQTVAQVTASGDVLVDRAALMNHVRRLSRTAGLSGILNADGRGELLTSADIGIARIENGIFVPLAIGRVRGSLVSISLLTPS